MRTAPNRQSYLATLVVFLLVGLAVAVLTVILRKGAPTIVVKKASLGTSTGFEIVNIGKRPVTFTGFWDMEEINGGHAMGRMPQLQNLELAPEQSISIPSPFMTNGQWRLGLSYYRPDALQAAKSQLSQTSLTNLFPNALRSCSADMVWSD